MKTPRQVTDEEMRIAEMAVGVVEKRIKYRMTACTYCDQGPNAYDQADRAIAAAFRDVYDGFRRKRRDIARTEKLRAARNQWIPDKLAADIEEGQS